MRVILARGHDVIKRELTGPANFLCPIRNQAKVRAFQGVRTIHKSDNTTP
jgi:hypothetical protein